MFSSRITTRLGLILICVLGIAARTGAETCCVGLVGDANGVGQENLTIGDISVIIDVLYVGGDWSLIPCLAEADVNQSGGYCPTQDDITIGDIAILVHVLYIPDFPPCDWPNYDCPWLVKLDSCQQCPDGSEQSALFDSSREARDYLGGVHD